MRISLLGELAKRKIFTIDDAKEISGIDKKILKVILLRLEKRGWIERIEKGKYMIIPLGSKKGEYTLNEFLIGSLLVQPCIISYWSALNYYGFTEQIPSTVFIQTTSRKKKQEIEIFGVRYKIIRVNREKIFGIEKTWIEEEEITITDKEETIIDCLDKPKYCGGIIEVAKSLKTRDYNPNKLVNYAERIGNSGVIRRLGYLNDLFSLQMDISSIKTRNYLLLDPTMPKKGETNAKWRLIINTDLRGIE